MELRHLHNFLVIAEESSLRHAAKRLHISQPPLTVQVKMLEDELGARLLERSKHGITLTVAGRVFLEHARTVLAMADEAKRAARHAQDGVLGTLRIGIMMPTLAIHLSGIIRNFRKKYPAVQLFLHELASAEQMQRLESDQLDLCLMRRPLASPGLRTRLIDEQPLYMVVPKGHRFFHRPRIEWADLRDESMVMLAPEVQFGLYDEFNQQCAKRGIVPSVSQYANNANMLLWMVSAGLGITLHGRLSRHPWGVGFRAPPPGLSPVQTVFAWKETKESPTLANFLKFFPERAEMQRPGTLTG